VSSESPAPNGAANGAEGQVAPAAKGWPKAIAAAALVLAGWVAWQAAALSSVRRQLEGRLLAAGIEEPQSLARLRSEPTAERARLAAARLIVHRVISAGEAERPKAAALLPEARELAERVLRERPSDWQASMLLGTATYLERALAQDRRLFTEAAAWEKPLRHAIELAPTRLEPKRLLATAYLEVWYALSPAKKEIARDVLRQVFAADQRAYRALLPAFIAATPDFREIFEVIPAEPEAWSDLERIYGERRAFGALAAAHEKRLAALEARLEARTGEAAERMRLGDFFRSRSLLLKNVIEAPPSLRFAPQVAKALELYPPGLHGLSSVRELRAWLDWLLDLDRLGIHPVEPKLVGRLLDAVGEIDAATGAHAALVAGDLYQAERYARLNEAPQLENWGPYLIARARREIAEGKYAEAREKLDMVYYGTQRQAPYLLARLELAKKLGDAGGIAVARSELARQQKQEWSALDWRVAGKRSRLEMLPARAAKGLEIEIQEAPGWGSVVDVLLDGRSLGVVIVQNGQYLRLRTPVDAKLHLLEMEPLVVAEVVPAAVRLLD
jgi:hypothetical protein